MVSIEEGDVMDGFTEAVWLKRRLMVSVWSHIERKACSRTVVSSDFKYSAGSFCLIAAGTNRTALMKGISSRTAQLDTLHLSQRHWSNESLFTYRYKSPILIGDLNSTIPR